MQCGTLYAFGGVHGGVGVGDEYDLADYDDDTDGPMNTVERYHPAANAWEAVAPMTMARRSPGVALLS